MVCASSQAVNDWYDRHVDAINEPGRPIPSGRIPGRWGFYLAVLWSGLSLLLGLALGFWAFAATLVAVFLAWAYSAPPLRLKMNGWWGNAAVGISYEGIAWFTGAAVMLGALPHPLILVLALLYSIGAHGIMTLNDFKSIEGDTKMGVRSLPVQLGPDRAARLACVVMALPQMAVILLLISIGRPVHAGIVLALLGAQVWLMRPLLADPRGKAIWYSAFGVLLYVLGMLASAFAVAPWSAG
jgi:chlorophyll synthase